MRGVRWKFAPILIAITGAVALIGVVELLTHQSMKCSSAACGGPSPEFDAAVPLFVVALGLFAWSINLAERHFHGA